MYILAIETTGIHASVALTDGKGSMRELVNEGTLNHLENLVPMIDQVIKEEGILKTDLSYIAVSEGPGSFTGIRIGVTTARSLCQNLGIKGIAVPTLKAFSYDNTGYEGILCPVFDARRNQVYAGAFKWVDGEVEEVVPAGPYIIDEYLGMLEGISCQCMFYGDGVRKYGEKIFETELDVKLAPEERRLQLASNIARMALDNIDSAADFNMLHPEYMRKPEAEQKREERLKNG